MNNVTKTGSTPRKGTTRKTAEPAEPAATIQEPAAATARKSPPRARAAGSGPVGRPPVSTEERERMIALAAYLRAEQRGFVGGDPMQDWLAAEIEIDTMLSQSSH